LETTHEELVLKRDQYKSEINLAKSNKMEITKRIKEIKSKIYDNQQELEKD